VEVCWRETEEASSFLVVVGLLVLFRLCLLGQVGHFELGRRILILALTLGDTKVLICCDL